VRPLFGAVLPAWYPGLVTGDVMSRAISQMMMLSVISVTISDLPDVWPARATLDRTSAPPAAHGPPAACGCLEEGEAPGGDP